MIPVVPPPATGARLAWDAAPHRVRSAVEQWLGSPIVDAVSQPTGFSPGVAARLRSRDGHRVFAKAAGPEPNAEVPAIHRREARVAAALPRRAPVPRLLWTFDEGEGGWIVLVFEDVEAAHPAQPWRADELDRVLRGLDELSAVMTPSPLAVAAVGEAGDLFESRLCGWRSLRDEQPSHLNDLDAWSRRNLEALVQLEDAAPSSVAGDTLLHMDIRADNLLLSSERLWVVDWPHACVGAAWVEVVLFAPSVTMQGGPRPEELMARSSGCTAADPAAVTAVVAAIAGFFTHQSLQSALPGLPTLRAFQAAQGAIARDWTSVRTGLR